MENIIRQSLPGGDDGEWIWPDAHQLESDMLINKRVFTKVSDLFSSIWLFSHFLA